MDTYSFINSKAISDYLREIKYEFNTKEVAWLIYQCNSISIHKKFEAWNQLIKDMPDCKIEMYSNSESCESLHHFLKQYMAGIEKQYELFEKSESNSFYLLDYGEYEKDECVASYMEYYKNLEDCWNDVSESKKVFDVGHIIIEKIYASENDKHISVKFEGNGELMSIESNMLDEYDEMINSSFEGMWFDFPVPFNKGDILYQKCNPILGVESFVKPFVLIGITPWEEEKNMLKKIKNGEYNSYKNAWGYFQNYDGTICMDTMWNYMNLEYYEGPFEGGKSLLIALSNYIKDEISLELLLTTHRKCIIDEFESDIMLRSRYTNKDLELAGLAECITEKNEGG